MVCGRMEWANWVGMGCLWCEVKEHMFSGSIAHGGGEMLGADTDIAGQ
jgi:hypothetical protein